MTDASGPRMCEYRSVLVAERGCPKVAIAQQPTPQETYPDRCTRTRRSIRDRTDMAAEMLITAGDNDRICSDAALAKLLRSVSDPGRVGQDQRTTSTQTRRQPTSQGRALQGGHRSNAMASSDDRLRRAPHLRWTPRKRSSGCLNRFVAREIYQFFPETSWPRDRRLSRRRA